jgi:hypothetical protein
LLLLIISSAQLLVMTLDGPAGCASGGHLRALNFQRASIPKHFGCFYLNAVLHVLDTLDLQVINIQSVPLSSFDLSPEIPNYDVVRQFEDTLQVPFAPSSSFC